MWKNAVPLRCRKCRARVSVKVTRALHASACFKPKQWSSGELSKCCEAPLVIGTYRLKKEHRRAGCTCSGYHFKHRIRSLWCVHNSRNPEVLF